MTPRPIPPQLPSTPSPRRAIPLPLVLGVVAAFAAAALIVLVVAVRWFSSELAKADPIPGITITIDTGNAPDPQRSEHAARAYLQRRLRQLGYDRSARPLQVAVSLKKVGAITYQDADEQVHVDKVQLEVAFYDAGGKQLTTVTAAPKMDSQESYQHHAETSLNRTAYSRAVGQILTMKLPTPDEL